MKKIEMKNLDLKKLEKKLPFKTKAQKQDEALKLAGIAFAAWVVYKLVFLSVAVFALGAAFYKHDQSFREEVNEGKRKLKSKAENVAQETKATVNEAKDALSNVVDATKDKAETVANKSKA